MFQDIHTYHRMPSEQAAIEHAAMLSKHEGVLSTGTQHTDKFGWRSFHVTNHLVRDVILPNEED